MEDDFDILYMVKTPFYLGNMTKALEECQQQSAEIQGDDHKNIQQKNLLMVRILTQQANFAKMKEHMHGMMSDTSGQQSKDVKPLSAFIQYLA